MATFTRNSWLPAITGEEEFLLVCQYRGEMWGLTAADYAQMIDDYVTNQDVEDSEGLRREAEEYCANPYAQEEAEIAGYWVRLPDDAYPQDNR